MAKTFTFRAEEGNFLMKASSGFALPQSLGDRQKFTHQDRSQAAHETGRLWKALKKVSPLNKKPERYVLFGPEDNFREIKNESSKIGYRMIDLDLPVDIELNADGVSGVTWVLLLSLHPMSPNVQSVMTQEEIVWPIAERFGVRRELEKEIGLTEAKARRWKTDEEYVAEDEEKKIKDEAKKAKETKTKEEVAPEEAAKGE